ncbi:MAG: aspartyl-tRNA amidotransferase [Phototrophicales bacterium]|nr:MAG: aspartyl-tRNA amidotransferase [Phototrophicales bacterium]
MTMEDPRASMQEALKKAMIEKDTLRRDVLRTVLSEFKQAEIDGMKTLTAEESIAILQREIKKRRESIDEARKAGRDDIADAAQAEIGVIEVFLPTQLSREQIEALVRDAIAQTGASNPKEMGKVMSVLMPKVKGVADGKLVNDIVREMLNG